MLFECPCNRTIDIPIKMYIAMVSDYELNRLCTEGLGVSVDDAWFNSHTASRGVVLTPEEVEQEEENEYEYEDVDCIDYTYEEE